MDVFLLSLCAEAWRDRGCLSNVFFWGPNMPAYLRVVFFPEFSRGGGK